MFASNPPISLASCQKLLSAVLIELSFSLIFLQMICTISLPLNLPVKRYSSLALDWIQYPLVESFEFPFVSFHALVTCAFILYYWDNGMTNGTRRDWSSQWLSDQVIGWPNRCSERAKYLLNALVDLPKFFWGERSHGVNTSSRTPFSRENSCKRCEWLVRSLPQNWKL